MYIYNVYVCVYIYIYNYIYYTHYTHRVVVGSPRTVGSRRSDSDVVKSLTPTYYVPPTLLRSKFKDPAQQTNLII